MLGASFFLIELLFTKIHLLVCIWYAWNNTGFIHFKICFKVLHCVGSFKFFWSDRLLSFTLEVSYHNTLVWTIHYLSIFGNATFCRRMKDWYWWWSRIIKFFIYNCVSVSGRCYTLKLSSSTSFALKGLIVDFYCSASHIKDMSNQQVCILQLLYKQTKSQNTILFYLSAQEFAIYWRIAKGLRWREYFGENW